MLLVRPLVWWRSLLLAAAGVAGLSCAAGQTEAPVQQAMPAWTAPFADPAFRQRVENADGVPAALRELRVPAAEEEVFYHWLGDHLRPPADHKIECLLRAHLARHLKRPPEEVSAADDVVLQAAPELPQGWFGRAEQYEADAQKQSAGWAAEAAAQGMRHVRLASPHWQAQLHGYRGVDWLAHAAQAGQFIDWVKAVAHALEDAPPGTAQPDACQLVLAILRHDAARGEPLLCLTLLDAVAASQPHLALGDPAGFAATMRDLGAAGQARVAGRLARLLVFAPAVPDVPARDAGQQALSASLQRGFSDLAALWEDTTPPHQPATLAWQILQMARAEDPDAFTADCLRAAEVQPENENIITHALLALALGGGIKPEQMALASRLGPESRARVALRLAAFAPPGSHPEAATGPWLEDLASGLITKIQAGTERAAFASFLSSLEGLERAGEHARLGHVLAAAAASSCGPRLNDLDHWERYAGLVLRRRDDALTQALAKRWSAAVDESADQKSHLLPLARTAIQAGQKGGTDFAMRALGLWERHHVEMSSSALPPPGEAARVGEALMACDHMEGFTRFVRGLEGLQKHRLTAAYRQMTQELAALRDLLEGRGSKLPEVEAWVRMPQNAAGEAPSVQWQFVLPEFSAVPDRPLVVTTGDRDARAEADRLQDARWWRAGTALPALARLGGKWTLEVMVGKNAKSVRPAATVREAPARGAVRLADLPESGCLWFGIHTREGERRVMMCGMPRAYSTLPALFASGPEPAAVEEAAPAPATGFAPVPPPPSWKPEDVARWGRLLAAPVAVQENQSYLLQEWPVAPISPVRMILLDADQRPLGPVPVASMGWARSSSNPRLVPVNRTFRCRTQRFRPGDWAGDGDLVFPADGRAGEQKARFVAFVARGEGAGDLPLLQLRPHPATTAEERAFSSPAPELPELNDEHMGELGFAVHAWHVTLASDRGILTGKGALAGFDVTRVPWKPLVRAESELIEGNEWPMCFGPERSMIIEPSWKGTRSLGLRFVPFDARGERYAGCQRLELPLPTYNRGEISEWMDGAVMMVSSQDQEHPEPVCAWVETDGRCHVVKMPRPPLEGNPGLEVAWWGPGGTRFTLHEAGLLFHMEHRDGLRLLGTEPGSPDDMPEGCSPGRSRRKRAWRLERPDLLAHIDKKTSAVLRRFHLPKPCQGTPMAFESRGYVILFTTSHEIIRVNPPPLDSGKE